LFLGWGFLSNGLWPLLFPYNGPMYQEKKDERMGSTQLIGIVTSAAIGAVLGAVLFDSLALGPGVLGIGIGAFLGALLGSVVDWR
jgi:ABC-type Fe3+-siderophore transport system permease subunit